MILKVRVAIIGKKRQVMHLSIFRILFKTYGLDCLWIFQTVGLMLPDQIFFS